MSWPVLLAGLSLVLGLLILVGAVRGYRRILHLIDQPTTSTRAAAVGLTEVTGRAVAVDDTFRSPFQERPCVLCHYAFYGRLPTQRSWKPPRDTGTLGVPFYVEDETGRILVRPEGADIRLPSHLTEVSGDQSLIEELSPEVTERFKDRRQNRDWPALTSTRATVANALYSLKGRHEPLPSGPSCGAEMRLEEGDTVYVIGHARPRDPDDENVSSAEDASELVIRKPSGSNGAFEWAFGVLPYLSAAYGSIFEIHAGSEEDLLTRHRREMWKGIFLGGSLLLLGLAGLLALLS